ncbi:ATP-grasp domain-containing protein [Bacillus cereus]|uniref:ATP-grasp domain-containing protein n=1 Tax=Bacillus cereus TaxID=1396 RepID=UPI000BF4F605|nr:ATP-grasp domain-containing protein [Bacillus cereus]PER10587.1 hypothetical protein CN489_17625 [Bacillus cereus]PFI78838.1 hypothetical protein COI83_26850 [Bacillus cereus]PFO99849.1 hypothetical protein COJ97_15120 [Bacillus cereus]
MKKNIIILNRLDLSKYYRNKKFIFNKEKYRIFLFSKKERVIENNLNDFDEVYAFDINDTKKVLDILTILSQYYKFTGVIAFSETDILTAAKIREILKIDGLNYEDAVRFRNKCIMKDILMSNNKNIKVPKYKKINCINDVLTFYEEYKKIVLKPINGTGTYKTYIIDNYSKLINIVNEIKDEAYNYEVEEYIEGDLYTCDSIIVNGEVYFSNVMKYSESTAEIKRTYLYLSMIDDENLLSKINLFNKEVLETFGIEQGVFHHEIFVNNQKELTFCEIAARPGGGAIVPTIEEIYGINLYETVVQFEIEEELSQIHKSYKKKLGGFIMVYPQTGIISQINEPLDLKKNYVMKFFNAWIGKKIIKKVYSSDAIATFVSTADNSVDLERKLIEIGERFQIEYS